MPSRAARSRPVSDQITSRNSLWLDETRGSGQAEWGEPGTDTRLRRMHSHLKWLAANASKREDAASYDAAITDWLSDAVHVAAFSVP